MSERDLADLSLLADDGRHPYTLAPADAAVSGGPRPIGAAPSPGTAHTGRPTAQSARGGAGGAGMGHGKGRAFINAARLRALRESRLLSQQDLADDFHRRRLQVSIATIKRAETGHAVRYRIVRELARYFEVPFDTLL